jgi:hypothetical protein
VSGRVRKVMGNRQLCGRVFVCILVYLSIFGFGSDCLTYECNFVHSARLRARQTLVSICMSALKSEWRLQRPLRGR